MNERTNDGVDRVSEDILRYIKAYQKVVGIPPTIREIMKHVKIDSTSHIAFHLKRLEKQGRIRRLPNKARGIVLVE